MTGFNDLPEPPPGRIIFEGASYENTPEGRKDLERHRKNLIVTFAVMPSIIFVLLMIAAFIQHLGTP
ncbi:MAG: hypothetical protein AAFY19_00600 [Pseudomonadota bacterium]